MMARNMLGLAMICSLLVRQAVPGDAVIRRKAGPSDIVITTTSRVAGAIHSLTWNGKEFIDSYDHGRQLQSAASFDGGLPGEFWAERFNPTEAGSRADGDGPSSSSRLVRLRAKGNGLETTTQMAFWLAPGEQSFGRDALNDRVLSDYFIAKRVKIGLPGLEHVISYDVTFTVPRGNPHRFAQFEALTGYIPAEFAQFWRFLPATGQLEKLDDGPGEQAYPVVMSTENGSHAMGIYSPDQPSTGFEQAGYGRFRFREERVVKWNCVFRVRKDPGGLMGKYPFRMFVAVGTREDVRKALVTLSLKSHGT